MYRAEDHGDGDTQDKRIQFKADEHGSYHGRVWFNNDMTTNNLKWFIDNDRAIYYGGGSSTSVGGSHNNLNISNEFKGDYILPDAIILPMDRDGDQARIFHLTGFYGGTDGGNHTAYNMNGI